MIITVQHLTRYGYDHPVRGVVQSHRLTPSRFDGQKVVQWQVTVSGGKLGAEFRDGAGDWVQAWTVPGPVTEIEVLVQGVVETTDLAGVLKGHREVIAPAAYLRTTPMTAPDAALAELSRSVQTDDPLALAHGLSKAVALAITYAPGVTHAHTTAAEALKRGEGVCQDHAQALIACARLRGLPARYVSGYLSSDMGGAAHEAAHAWAELQVPGFGWIGFDPANQCCPDARYIRLGSGLDAREAAPIRGTARNGSAENMGVEVAVQAQGQ